MLTRSFAALLRTLGFLIHKFHRLLVSNILIHIEKKKHRSRNKKTHLHQITSAWPFQSSRGCLEITDRAHTAPRRFYSSFSSSSVRHLSPLTCTLTCYVAHATTVGQGFNDRQPCKAGRLGFARLGPTRLGTIRFDLIGSD